MNSYIYGLIVFLILAIVYFRTGNHFYDLAISMLPEETQEIVLSSTLVWIIWLLAWPIFMMVAAARIGQEKEK